MDMNNFSYHILFHQACIQGANISVWPDPPRENNYLHDKIITSILVANYNDIDLRQINNTKS